MFTEGLPVDHRLDCLLKHDHLAAGVDDGWVVLINEEMLKPESISLIIDHVLDLFLDLGLFKVAQFGFRRSDLLGSGFKALNAFEAELPVRAALRLRLPIYSLPASGIASRPPPPG